VIVPTTSAVMLLPTEVNPAMSDDLNPAKVREVSDPDGQLHDRNRYLEPHTGHVEADLAELVSWSRRSWSDFDGSDVEAELVQPNATGKTTRAIEDGRTSQLAFETGVTEQRLSADEFTYTRELISRVKNNDAPMFLVGFGLPNSGKTGHILHDWYRAWRAEYPDGILISNASIPAAAEQFVSLDKLVGFCIRNPDVRKFIFLDEGSTHFDARTNSHEVASQFSPFSKRFAKLSIDFATIGHTVMDVHPELKRQATTMFHKPELKQVQFYDGYDEDRLTDPVFPAPVDGLEEPAIEYDPDDWSPLLFDLQPEKLLDPSA